MADADDDLLIASKIDVPAPGAAFGRAFVLEGWALAREGRVATVELWRQGRRLGMAVPDVPRRDVAAAYPEHPEALLSGFMVPVALPPGDAGELIVMAALESGRGVRLGAIPLPAIAPGSPGPDPGQRYPIADLRRVGFVKNCVANPRIIVGDFTYCDHAEDAARFEEQVLYLSEGMTDRLIIGKFCSIARGVTFMMNGANHSLAGFSTFPFHAFRGGWEHTALLVASPIKGDIVIGNDVWLGYDALILPGVTIGDGAVVGARAVVAKDVPPYAIVAGNPARPIRSRYDDATVARLLALRWWDWPLETLFCNLDAIVRGDLAALAAAGPPRG